MNISNVVCSNSASGLGSIISSIPGHVIEGVRLNDIYIQHQGGGSKDNAQVQPAEEENKYPEPTVFGNAMPSHGFFIRHARNIQLSNIETVCAKEDLRPAFVLQDVQDADFFRVRRPRVKDIPTFVLNNVDGFSVYRSRHVPDTQFNHAGQEKL